jgi:hypothetical protein
VLVTGALIALLIPGKERTAGSVAGDPLPAAAAA